MDDPERTRMGAPRRRGQRITRWTDRNGIPSLATEERVRTRVKCLERDPRPEFAQRPWRAVVEVWRIAPPCDLIANAAGHGATPEDAVAKTRRRAACNRRQEIPPTPGLGTLRVPRRYDAQ